MGRQLYTNNASSTLAADITMSDTTLTLATGTGSRFAAIYGADWQMATITNGIGWREIVKITARTDDVLTIVREQEGSSIFDWVAGSVIEARLTAGMLDRLVENQAAVPGLAIGGAYPDGYGVAIGARAKAVESGGVAVGSDALALAAGSVALGAIARAFRPYQLIAAAHPCIPRDDWFATTGSQYNAGMESVWATRFLELGTPATWAASTVYTDGDVVRPTTPNGFQYTLWMQVTDATLVNTMTSTAAEPTWPTAIEDCVEADAGGLHYWIASNLATGADEITPDGMIFYPTEVGFLCFTHSGVSAAPYVSIGTVASPTLLVNNQQLSSITGANQRHVFTGLKHGISGLRVKLNTAATGASARFHGRFYAKGIFIQTQG